MKDGGEWREGAGGDDGKRGKTERNEEGEERRKDGRERKKKSGKKRRERERENEQRRKRIAVRHESVFEFDFMPRQRNFAAALEYIYYRGQPEAEESSRALDDEWSLIFRK